MEENYKTLTQRVGFIEKSLLESGFKGVPNEKEAPLFDKSKYDVSTDKGQYSYVGCYSRKTDSRLERVDIIQDKKTEEITVFFDCEKSNIKRLEKVIHPKV